MQVRAPSSAGQRPSMMSSTGLGRNPWRVNKARAVAAVVAGSLCQTITATADGVGVGVALIAPAVAVVVELSLLLAHRSGRIRAAPVLVAVFVGLLVVVGPFVGRADVITVSATTALAHLLLVGSWPRRRWPSRPGWLFAAMLSAQGLWLAGSGTGAATLSVVAAVWGWEACQRDGRRSDPLADVLRRGSELADSLRRKAARRWHGVCNLTRRLPEAADPFVLAAATMAWSAPLLYAFARTQGTDVPRVAGWFNDFPAHFVVVDRLGLHPVVVPPHPLFHVATRLGEAFVSQEVAATVVLSLCAAVAALGLLRLTRRPMGVDPGLGRCAAIAVTLVLVVAESPAVLLMVTGVVSPLSTFAPFHVWNSPTETVALAATLLLLPFLLDAVEGRVDNPSGWRRLSWLVVLATVAKPTFTMVLVVALPLFLWVSGRWGTPDRPRLLRHVTIPTLVVLALQVGSLVLFAPAEYRVGVTLGPFAMVRHFGIGASGPVYFAGPIVVLLALWAGGRRYLSEPSVGLAWTALGVSLVPLLLLRETGPMANDGNTAKLSIVCWLVVVTVTVRFLAGQLRRSARVSARRLWLTVTSVYAAAAVVSGLLVWWVMVVDGGVS